MQKVSINSIILGKDADPSGKFPPFLMLHGWNRNCDDLLPLAELLSPYMEVHALDLPGFGSSDLPDGDWDTQQYAARIVQYMDDHSLDCVNLFGHSFGGRVSLRISSAYPERVHKLVLAGSHGLKRKRGPWDQIRVKAIPKLGKTVKLIDKITGSKLFQNKFIPKFGSKDYQAAGALRGTLVKTVIEDQTDETRKVKAPALLLWGEKDTETPLEMGQRFSRLIPNAKLISLPQEGHDLFQDINSHLCAYYIKGFLNPQSGNVSSTEQVSSSVNIGKRI